MLQGPPAGKPKNKRNGLFYTRENRLSKIHFAPGPIKVLIRHYYTYELNFLFIFFFFLIKNNKFVVFGLDNDLTSNTTRSLDLESLLGGAWGTAQSVSDSEADTQGIRRIRSQLEGLEQM